MNYEWTLLQRLAAINYLSQIGYNDDVTDLFPFTAMLTNGSADIINKRFEDLTNHLYGDQLDHLKRIVDNPNQFFNIAA